MMRCYIFSICLFVSCLTLYETIALALIEVYAKVWYKHPNSKWAFINIYLCWKKVVKSKMWLPWVQEIEKQMVHKILVSPWLGMLCINTILCDKISTYIDIMWFQLVVILYIDGTITFFISLHGALRKLYTCELPIHMYLNKNLYIYIAF